jgi:hypothetical protein
MLMDKEEILKTIYDAKLRTITTVATIALTALGAGFIVITIYSGFTLKSERELLKDLEKQVQSKSAEQVSIVKALEEQIKNRMDENTGSIKALEQRAQAKSDEQVRRVDLAILKTQKAPKVVALIRSGVALHGNIVKAHIMRRGEQDIMMFTIILKNEGTATSDPLFLKWYSREPFKSKNAAASSDEPGYDYENHTDPNNPSQFPPNAIKVLPPQATMTFNVEGPMERIDRNRRICPMALKIYYGTETPYRAEFSLEIKELGSGFGNSVLTWTSLFDRQMPWPVGLGSISQEHCTMSSAEGIEGRGSFLTKKTGRDSLPISRTTRTGTPSTFMPMH